MFFRSAKSRGNEALKQLDNIQNISEKEWDEWLKEINNPESVFNRDQIVPKVKEEKKDATNNKT